MYSGSSWAVIFKSYKFVHPWIDDMITSDLDGKIEV